jgi:hypothetical protein
MVKILAATSLILLFGGCSLSPKIKVPVLDKIEPLGLVWYWKINGTFVPEFGKSNVVILDKDMFQEIQNQLVQRRITANQCRETSIIQNTIK